MSPFSTNEWIHIGAGAIALGIGLTPLLSVKGGSHHRRFGRMVVALGAVVLATALFGVLAGTAPTALVAVTLTAAYEYVGSLRALALRGRAPGWPDALLACTAIVLAMLLLLRGGPGTTSWPPALAYGTLGFVIALAPVRPLRHFWANVWMRRALILDHGLKMTGFYFAMASAGAGNLLRGGGRRTSCCPVG
ncbi:MAG: hypothetical protein IPK29_18240 [Betaproteobacteria bacterium]|nr:hypothetical protein [Betaproteobacteria bacterium]